MFLPVSSPHAAPQTTKIQSQSHRVRQRRSVCGSGSARSPQTSVKLQLTLQSCYRNLYFQNKITALRPMTVENNCFAQSAACGSHTLQI